MSETVCLPPIVSALKKADDVIGQDRVWQSNGDQNQTTFLRYYTDDQTTVPNITEIQSIASWSAAEINQFLKDRGFDIKLEDFDESEFGVASVLDLLVEWLHKGREVQIVDPSDQKTYPGVRLSKEAVEIFQTSNGHAVACIKTKSGDQVYMMIHDPRPNQSKSFVWYDWVAYVETIEQDLTPSLDYEGLMFPMVDLDQKPDINWLKGLVTTTESGQRAEVSQAVQQTKLRMNTEGARVESAAAIGICITSVRVAVPLLINQPFLVWFRRSGLKHPLFVGHVTQEDWKDPGTLGDKDAQEKDAEQTKVHRNPVQMPEFPVDKGPKDRSRRFRSL